MASRLIHGPPMRYLLLIVLLLTACAALPQKLAWFKLDKGQWDVVWVLSPDGKIYRCTGRDDKPECRYAQNVGEPESPSAPTVAPSQPPTAAPEPPSAKAAPPPERRAYPGGTGLLE